MMRRYKPARRTAPQFIRIAADGVPLDPATASAAAPGWIALVPGAAAPLIGFALPARLRGTARLQVAWRQLRDSQGLTPQEAEMRPFVPGGGQNWCRAVVADKGAAAEWRTRCGQGCRAILPTYLALPATAGLWVIDIRRDGIDVRMGVADGFGGEEDLARLMLQRALAEVSGTDAGADAPKAVLVLARAPDWLRSICAEQDLPLIEQDEAKDGPNDGAVAAALAALGLPRPAVLAHGELAADMRQDVTADRSRLRGQILPWRWPLAAALAGFAIWSAGLTLEARRLEERTAQRSAETEALVRRYFVPSGPLLDVRLQVSRALADLARSHPGDTTDLSVLRLLEQAAVVAARSGAQPVLVNYSGGDTLSVVLKVADFAAADQLAGLFDAAGLQADVQDARALDEDGGVELSLMLRQAAQEDAG